jgi:hypothetical protein
MGDGSLKMEFAFSQVDSHSSAPIVVFASSQDMMGPFPAHDRHMTGA